MNKLTRCGAFLVATCLCFLIAIPRQAPAAPPPDEREEVDKVNKAIDRGVQYLRTQQRDGNNWEGYWATKLVGLEGGVTALTTLALLNCGVKTDEKEIKGALEYLRGIPPSWTYTVALTTMVFAEARQARDLPIIQTNIDWILRTAIKSNGKIIGWSYPREGDPIPDGSNTQYALLALYAGKMAGAKVSEADWTAIRQLYIDSQQKEGDDSGYWKYTNQGRTPSFTMTVAGVSGLVIAGMGLNQSQQQLDVATGIAAKCGRYDSNAPIARGLNYIGRNFTFTLSRGQSTYYNMYGLERVGRLSGQRFLGRTDWYRDGCKFLVEQQKKEGFWAQNDGEEYDAVNVISTSFALLFLSKGRTPVLISKLAYGDFSTSADQKIIQEKGSDPGVVGWNRKNNDARHITEFASRELFKGLPLGWQVYDPRRRELARNEDILAEVGVLVQSPILYFNGHEKPALRGQHREILKRYIEEGGFVIAEACCGSPEFAAGFRELIRDLFPDSKLQPLPPEHPIWRSYFAVPPTEFPKLECLDRGCRTVLVFSPEPLAGYWEEARFMPPTAKKDVTHGEQAFRLAGNIVAYATGMEPPQQRLTVKRIIDSSKDVRNPPKGFLKACQLRLSGENAPAPAAMRNVMGYLQANARLDVVLEKESLVPDSPDLTKYKFLYMHGRKRFTFSDDEITNIKANLQSGGVLLADPCCGKAEFDQAFRAMVLKMYPDQKLEVIPQNDELYSAALNGGVAITTVKRREKTNQGGNETGFSDLPPFLEGIKYEGRWVVIYSKYDLGCSLEGHKSTDCLGHSRDSALKLASAAVLYGLKK